MPSFEGGAITIVPCPDSDASVAPMGRHHQGGGKKFQQYCPYAAASGAAAPLEFALFAALLLAGTALLSGRPFRLIERQRSRDRPRSRGPPTPAAA
ncbi:MAG: hypothetical protein ACJ8EH_00280 [Sphingomicrobium sp.]